MASKRKRIYASIEKMEPQDDGTLKVWGYASSGSVDSDGETITAAAMKAALPDYMKFGAVREMHQPMAAGTAIEAHVEEDTGKTWFGAHVVDPIAVKKVETGVYKGFSIGGKVTKRNDLKKTQIDGLNLVEVSLVDRPANPEAVFTLCKAERTPDDEVEELAELLDSGAVTPGDLLAFAAKMKTTGSAEPEPVVKAEDSNPTAGGTGSQAGDPPLGVPTNPEPDAALEQSVVKGMYTLAQMAQMLDNIAYLCQDVKFEAEYEGDGSPLPASLSKWLKDGLAIFNTMAAEETAELINMVTAKKAASAGDLAKGADTNGIAPVPDAINIGTIEKMLADHIAPLNESLQKLGKENDDLKQQVATMSKRAAPGKALLKAVALSKSQDVVADPDDSPDEQAPAEGTLERAQYEMKKVFGAGGRRLS